jgi:hypothetical protein
MSTALSCVESSWNLMAHGDAREGKWGGNWRMEWVASVLHTTSEHDVSSITTADAHNSSVSSKLNWRPPADLNGFVLFAERRNLVSARVPSHFKLSLPLQTPIIGNVAATTTRTGRLWQRIIIDIIQTFQYWHTPIWRHPHWVPMNVSKTENQD